MKLSIRKGFSFGLTSGVITTLGLMVGLHSSTHSAVVVIGGIISIAIADAFSDALGMHISEESENHHSVREIWESTISTFVAKFVFALTFVVPVLLFSLSTAIWVSIVWGLSVITAVSFRLAKITGGRAIEVVSEHLIISLLVILVTHYVGDWIATFS